MWAGPGGFELHSDEQDEDRNEPNKSGVLGLEVVISGERIYLSDD
jgi:hypothetical protein